MFDLQAQHDQKPGVAMRAARRAECFEAATCDEVARSRSLVVAVIVFIRIESDPDRQMATIDREIQ